MQALRALAVLLVVLFHFWPDRVTGGYIGVDVFFVISGFLITAHLLRELRRTGTVKLLSFYARRITRLLPAAFLVLAVALLGVLTLVPQGEWSSMLRDIWSSAVYSVNWVLAASSVDYFAADEVAGPVQHYWSLAVEEQFYIVWPLLLVLAWWLRRRKGIVIILAFVFVASLACSVVGAYRFQEFAYFATFSHGWEFAAGGAIAVLLWMRRLPDGWWMTGASWCGWALIVTSALFFDSGTLFPGWVALAPVLGTALVIIAGMPGGGWSASNVVSWRPVQFIGDISYSLYLWHWLPIVFLPYVLSEWADRTYLTASEKCAVLVICVLLAWATKAWIEDPGRRVRFLKPNVRTFVAAAVASALIVAATLIPTSVLAQQRAADAARLDSAVEDALSGAADPCFGALATANSDDCNDSHVVADRDSLPFLADDTEFAWVDRRETENSYFTAECASTESGNSKCLYGSGSADVTLAVVGDSHAGHLLPAVLTVSEAHGWDVEVWRMAECTPAMLGYFAADDADGREECREWRESIFDDVSAGDADIVVTTSYTARYTRWMRSSPERVDPLAEAFSAGWDEWQSAGIKVLAVADTPQWPNHVPRCLNAAASVDDPCAHPRSKVIHRDPIPLAVEMNDSADVQLLDLSDRFCDEDTCHAVVGGIAVGRDLTHLTATFATTLSPYFDVALRSLTSDSQ